MAVFKIAVIPGDGIGPEIIREAVRVLDRAAEKFGVVEKSGAGGKKEFSYTKGGKEIGDEEFQALKNRLGNEWERNEEYMEWKSLK